MANVIKIKNSTVAGKAPKPADLDRAELAINLADKKIYTKDASDAIIELGNNPTHFIKTTDPTTSDGNDGDIWFKIT
jgi:hypothetical protein